MEPNNPSGHQFEDNQSGHCKHCGCVRSAHAEQQAVPIPEKKAWSRRGRPKFVLSEPIDFSALEQAYAGANWKWRRGVVGRGHGYLPSSEQLKEAVEYHTAQADPYSSSGGIIVRIIDGKPLVAIDHKLQEHLPAGTPGYFTEDKGW